MKVENGKLKIVVGNKVLLSTNLIIPDRIYVIFGRGAIETVFINKNRRATRVILHKIPV